MPEFRYAQSRHWWKGNTHLHSTASDGGKSFLEIADLYHAAGYDFLFRTDHWVTSHARSDGQTYPLLWLDGIELDGPDPTGAEYHVVGLGHFQGVTRELGLQAAMEAIHVQGGLLVLAHPHWTGNTFEDALRWPFDGVEVYNHICRWLNGKGDGGVYWSAMLTRNPNTLAFAADDAHLKPEHPGYNGGWVMVNAETCTPDAILTSLRDGNFYSSCGPLIKTIAWDGQRVSIQSSPVQVIRLVGPGWRGDRAFDSHLLTQASFEIPTSWRYAYLEIEDLQGRRAWTNPLFIYE